MAGDTFNLEIDGIGAFTFRKRTMRSQFKIEAEAGRLLGGPCTDELLSAGAIAFATLSVLTVEAPQGWDLEAFDPLSPDDTARLFAAHRRLREAEAGFRSGSGGGGAGSGAGA